MSCQKNDVYQFRCYILINIVRLKGNGSLHRWWNGFQCRSPWKRISQCLQSFEGSLSNIGCCYGNAYYKYCVHIAVMSFECHGISSHRQLHCLFNRLFNLTSKNFHIIMPPLISQNKRKIIGIARNIKHQRMAMALHDINHEQIFIAENVQRVKIMCLRMDALILCIPFIWMMQYRCTDVQT